MSEFTDGEYGPEFEPGLLEQLTAHVRLLKASDSTTRRRFRLLEAVCSQCGQVVADVYGTSPVPAITYRRVALFDGEVDDPRGGYHVHPLGEDQDYNLLPAGCACTKHMVRIWELQQTIEEGRRKLTLVPQAHDPREPTTTEMLRRLRPTE